MARYLLLRMLCCQVRFAFMFHTFLISLKIRGQIFGGWCDRYALLINLNVRFDQHFTTRNQTVSILANITSHKYQLMKQQSHRKYTSTGKGVGLTDLLWYVFAQQCATFTYFYQPQGMYHVSIFIYYNCYKLVIISRQEINVIKLRKEFGYVLNIGIC